MILQLRSILLGNQQVFILKKYFLQNTNKFEIFYICRLYGFKIHPIAYQVQQQSASTFKAPLRALNFNNGKR